MPATTEVAPAGFWQRYAAWSLDAAGLALPTLLSTRAHIVASEAAWQRFGASMSALFEASLRDVLRGMSPLQSSFGLLGDPALAGASNLLRDALWATLAWPLAVFVCLALCWHAAFEQARWRGTPGKRALGLRVVTANGETPSLPRSVGRFLAGGISWLTLNIGHAMAALPPAHLALHDRLSGTRVLANRRGLPGWAKAWLWLQLAAFVAANAWLLLQVDAAVQAVVERSLRY